MSPVPLFPFEQEPRQPVFITVVVTGFVVELNIRPTAHHVAEPAVDAIGKLVLGPTVVEYSKPTPPVPMNVKPLPALSVPGVQPSPNVRANVPEPTRMLV